jgi:hypothetical protein
VIYYISNVNEWFMTCIEHNQFHSSTNTIDYRKKICQEKSCMPFIIFILAQFILLLNIFKLSQMKKTKETIIKAENLNKDFPWRFFYVSWGVLGFFSFSSFLLSSVNKSHYHDKLMQSISLNLWFLSFIPKAIGRNKKIKSLSFAYESWNLKWGLRYLQ